MDRSIMRALENRTCVVVLLLMASACSASSASHRGGAGIGAQAGAAAGGGSAGHAGDMSTMLDAAAPVLDASVDDLAVTLQVNGSTTTCGTCSVLITDVRGGKAPYTYQWSDTTLSGPGPHKVCPSKPTEYTLTVKDNSAIDTSEFMTPAQSAKASGKVECTPVDDAGIDDDHLTGCYVSTDSEKAGVSTKCDSVDGGVSRGPQLRTTFPFPKPLKAGKPYELSYDEARLTIGFAPIVVDIYGSNTSCDISGQKLATLTLDSATPHQAHCFTPDDDYDAFTTVVSTAGVLFDFAVTFTGTWCDDGCVQSSPDAGP